MEGPGRGHRGQPTFQSTQYRGRPTDPSTSARGILAAFLSSWQCRRTSRHVGCRDEGGAEGESQRVARGRLPLHDHETGRGLPSLS